MTTAKKKTRRPAQLKTTPLPEDQWDFAACPHPEQTKACYLYEYSIDSKLVKREVEAQRRKWILQKSPSVKQKVADWWQSNPKPPGGGFASLPTKEEREWLRKFREAIPEADPTTKLHQDLHFLLACEYFPEKHWLEIPVGERQLIAKEFYPDRHRTGSWTDPLQSALRLEASPLRIEPLEDFLNSESSPLYARLGLKGHYVFSFSWERSSRKLTDDFGQWLEENRPKDQPGFHLSKQSTSRTTSPRDLLKNLSALRLIRHFDGDVDAARDHYHLVLCKFLYKDDSAWKRAAKKALREIKRFDKLAE
jgi:hypothetical protein